jgi:hypothetical protein
MEARSGPEIAAIPDERAPLLPHNETRDIAILPSDNDDVPPPPLSKWRYVLFALSIILGASILGLFVKGWMDTDDVEVSLVVRTHAP